MVVKEGRGRKPKLGVGGSAFLLIIIILTFNYFHYLVFKKPINLSIYLLVELR